MRHDDPLAQAVVVAVRGGDLAALRQLLADHPELATARIVDDRGGARTLLHVLTDWPARCPHGAETVAALVSAGADVNARFQGSHSETPLHWAASADDVVVLNGFEDVAAWLRGQGGRHAAG